MSGFSIATTEKDPAQFALAIQQLYDGRSNASGTVTLAAGATSTVVSAINCAPQSAVFLFPKTANAAAALASIVQQQIFAASGTYTPSAGMVSAVIECVGGGASGGGTGPGTAATCLGGGGGQAGGYSRKLVTASDIGASKAVTIGAAGAAPTAGNNAGNDGTATSVGTLCVANGGKGGGAGTAGTAIAGGSSAVAGTGDFCTVGDPGGNGFYSNVVTLVPWGGKGGGTMFGGGAPANITTTSSNGAAAKSYGGGGSGGASFGVVANTAGGAGFAGCVIITETCSPTTATTFISAVGVQHFTITHANNAQVDRTFFFVCIG